MPSIKSVLLVLFLLISFSAKANFDFNAACIRAYKEIFSLRLQNAQQLIDAEKKRNPQNAIPYLLDSYVDHLIILTTESKSEFSRLKNSKAALLSRIEKDDKNSPYYLFALAEIHMQWALANGYFQEYLASSVELKKAYGMLKENQKKFPSFLLNQKNLGLLNAVLGSLPPSLKRTVSVLGMRGNTQSGIRMIENLVNTLPKTQYAHFYDDAVFCLAYVQMNIANNHSAYSKIVANAQKIDSSSLLRSYIIGFAGFRTGHTDEAIRTLNARPKGGEYQYFGYLDYMSGVLRARKLDQSAIGFFQNYLRSYRGINYVKDTYLNLAWLALLRGNVNEYKEYITQVKSKGNSLHEKDKQALQEASDPIPNIDLLKARLLFDGGYYEQAFAEIKDKKANDFKLLRDRIEFCYRAGRIYDETGKDDLAIKFYQFAIDIGKNERYYFASNAAYRAGFIYERKKNFPKAEQYYDIAIDMEDHDYERSTEAKAKEGLSRIDND
jgi:tetratricopeptide (TPR) repeat protein